LAEREEVVARYVDSGLTQRVFAREEGIGVSTLQLWLRQMSAPGRAHEESSSSKTELRSAPAGFSLLEVELEDAHAAPVAAGAPYELVWPCGRRLRLARGFCPREVRGLLALLQEAS
jgi:transposase-like protein